jgi:DNA-binding PadR family transcriptional regulator
MSLKYIVLGFLSYGPHTGYDLKKHIDNSTRFFWHAKLSQIYPTLRELAERGLVEADTVPQEGKPDKKIYSITETGRKALRDWLEAPVEGLSPTKDAALLKLFFSGSRDKKVMVSHLHHQLALHRRQLVHYQQETTTYIARIIAETGLDRDGKLWELTRRFGEEYERTYIQWLENAIKTVERM